jgi:hypothetical protein
MPIMVNNSARPQTLINIQHTATGRTTQHSSASNCDGRLRATNTVFGDKQTTSHHTYNSALTSQKAKSVSKEAKQM